MHFYLLCNPCMALDFASSLSRKLAYVPGPTFGFVKLLASSGSHCTKWADEQHRPAGFEARLVPDPPPIIPTLIGLRAFDLVSSRVWWEAATNIGTSYAELIRGIESYVIRGCIRLTATSSGRFNYPFLYGRFKGLWEVSFCESEYLWRSLMTSRNGRPGGKHEEDSLRPAGLNHRSVPLVCSAAQR